MWPLLLGIAHAQSIYNPLDPRPDPPEVGAAHAVAFSVDLDRGNTDQTAISATAGSTVSQESGEWRLVITGKTAWSAGEPIAQSGFAHARRTHVLTGPWRWLTFTQASANPFQSLLLRALAGTGIEWTVYPEDGLRVSLATTVMAEYQVLEPGVDDADEGLRARSSSYGIVAARIHPRLVAGVTAFVQPRLDAPANYRASGDAFVTLDLSSPHPDPERPKPRAKGLIRQSFDLAYDSVPPPEVRPLDFGLTTTFTLAFR